MAVVLALISALAYGLTDFLGGVLSRRTSAWSVAVVAQVSCTVCTAVVAAFTGGHPTPVALCWAALAGVGCGAGTGFLYRGFASGRMSVVAPVSAVGAALVPVLVGALAGERLSVWVWLGVVAALPAIWMVSSSPGSGRPGRAAIGAGLLDGALAGLGFGVLFAALGQVPASAGWWPLVLSQAVSVPSLVLLGAVLGAAWRPRGRTVRLALLAGPMAATATGAFLLATQHGLLTVAGVLTSLYPASTVLLAAAVLHEKVHRAQGVGLGLCALAVVLVAAG
jgi:uncharacterized membrane protein